jgi:hypothetical protein
MLKELFNFCFFYLTHLPIGALLCIGKPPCSLWFDQCLKSTAWLRDLTDNCTVCVGYRDEVVIQKVVVHVKLYYCTQSLCNLLCDLLSTCLPLNVFRLAITKGLNTYWLKTFQLFILNSFANISKNIIPLWHYRVLCVGQWNKISIYSKYKFSLSHNKMWKGQGVWIFSEGTIFPSDYSPTKNLKTNPISHIY